VERIEGISLIGLPNVELLPDPEDPDEVEPLAPFAAWWIPGFDEFVSHEDDEFLGEFKEFMDVWFEGGGGADLKKF
jgi:hypothetical protein